MTKIRIKGGILSYTPISAGIRKTLSFCNQLGYYKDEDGSLTFHESDNWGHHKLIPLSTLEDFKVRCGSGIGGIFFFAENDMSTYIPSTYSYFKGTGGIGDVDMEYVGREHIPSNAKFCMLQTNSTTINDNYEVTIV